MKRTKKGWTNKQYRYMELLLNNTTDRPKKELAIKAGYSVSVANTVATHIEKTEGYSNARRDMALKVGEVVTAVVHEIMSNRDMAEIDYKDLLATVKIMSDAMDKIAPTEQKTLQEQDTGNRLRTIVLQNVETQNITQEKQEEIVI